MAVLCHLEIYCRVFSRCANTAVKLIMSIVRSEYRRKCMTIFLWLLVTVNTVMCLYVYKMYANKPVMCYSIIPSIIVWPPVLTSSQGTGILWRNSRVGSYLELNEPWYRLVIMVSKIISWLTLHSHPANTWWKDRMIILSFKMKHPGGSYSQVPHLLLLYFCPSCDCRYNDDNNMKERYVTTL